jgi:hypothetical protein
MIDSEKTDSNKTPLALAALMFFSPFIHYFLNKKSIPLSDQDTEFISGYVKLGYLNLFFLIIAISTGVGNYLVKLPFLQVLYAISMSILLVFLLVGTIAILSDVSLHLEKNLTLSYYDIGEKRK